MSYLTINGISVNVALTSASKTRDVIGAGITRAQDGSARNNFNAKKWHLKAKTTPMLQTEALFLRTLLDGLGDRWNFDADLYSDKGAKGTGGSVVTSSPTPKRGAGCLSLANGVNFTATVDAPVGTNSGFTVAFWNSPTATNWTRYIVTRDYSGPPGVQTVYVAGSVGALPSGVGPAVTISGGVATLLLTNGSGATQGYDDVLFIPAYLPPSLVSGLDALMNSQAWATFPALTVGGDFHPVSMTMLGQPGDEQVNEVFLSGSLQDNAVEISFDLMES